MSSEDEYIESLPKGERQRIMGLIAQDPTSELESEPHPLIEEVKRLQAKSEELLNADNEHHSGPY